MSRATPMLAGALMFVAASGCSLAGTSPDDAGDDESTLVITTAGDYGASDDASAVLDIVNEIGPDAHVALGDLSYGQLAPEAAWCGFVTSRVGEDLPFQIVAGNHDSLDEGDASIAAFAECLPNRVAEMTGDYGREYWFDLPSEDPLVRVIAASPGLTFDDGLWEYREGDAHYTWLESAIEQARTDGIPWVIVAAHEPCPTIGVHSCPEVTDFYDLLLQERVDLALFGHEHSYMRTHQLVGGEVGCPSLPLAAFDASCVVDTDDAYAAGAGTVMATVGTGGMPIRDVDADGPAGDYFATYNSAVVNPAFGVLKLAVNKDELRATFVPTTPGAFLDSFTVQR